MNRQQLSLAIIVFALATGAGIVRAQVYKWTDASGQVHYSQKKPDDATPVQTLDIAPPPPGTPANPDSAAEIARLNALSEQMARERQAAEQTRQERAIRDLELANQQLQNDLLNQQLQQQKEKDDSDNVISGYLPFYPYPYPYPYPRPYPPYPSYPPKPHPPHPWPCEPWPACRQPPPLAPLRPGPLAKPLPTFQPKPAPVAPAPGGFFRGR